VTTAVSDSVSVSLAY